MILLVDLDGTLTDPAEGIIGSVRHALKEAGFEAPPAEQLGWVIGPPLRTAFPKIVGPEADIEHLVSLYRERYGKGGLYEATVYEGIHDALRMLRERATKMYVCTAKPGLFAEKILAHFELDKHFDAIYGPDLAGKLDNKGDLIAHMLEQEGFDPELAIMIGDRGSDAHAAARHGIPTVGCLWGYGSEHELEEAGAAAIIARPTELPGAIDSVWSKRS